MAPILDVAAGWATHLSLPVDFICMDVMDLGFKPNSFDGFLLEFYGNTPSLDQTLALQRGLANALKPDGRGFIVSNRKKYSSYWSYMGSTYPRSMVNWLAPQASLDFMFSETDGCGEGLIYGLYSKFNTMESLSSELSHSFKVLECLYEQDPRYIIAVVEPKATVEFHTTIEEDHSSNLPKREPVRSNIPKVRDVLKKIEVICDQLETHASGVSEFFESSERSSAGNCLQTVSTDLTGFIYLLKDVVGPD